MPADADAAGAAVTATSLVGVRLLYLKDKNISVATNTAIIVAIAMQSRLLTFPIRVEPSRLLVLIKIGQRFAGKFAPSMRLDHSTGRRARWQRSRVRARRR